MSTLRPVAGALALGGAPLDGVLAALRTKAPHARAAYVYDLGALEARAARLRAAFDPLGALPAYALKANGHPELLRRLAARGFGGEAGSLGELEMARAAGFDAPRRILNGNGRTPEEAAWVVAHGVHSVNADHVGELDLLEAAAARHGAKLRVALRVNPGIAAAVHRHIMTGHDDAKFGVSPEDALEAWSARARWPHLQLDGVHVHIGSQLMDLAPVHAALDGALAWIAEAARRGAPLALLNLGGGFGVDYSGAGRDFPIEAHAAGVEERVLGRGLELVIEPGRWLTAPVGVLIAEVLAVKLRAGRRFIVLAAGMNDLIRPALYGARHRIEPVRARPGDATPAIVVGPVCESADVFDEAATLPPVEVGDLMVLHDTGAYGACMASEYNGRPRLAEVLVGEPSARGGGGASHQVVAAAQREDDRRDPEQ